MGNRWMNRLIWMTLSKRIVEKKIKPLPFRRALISCWGITGKFPWMRDIGNIPTLQRMTWSRRKSLSSRFTGFHGF